MFHETVNHPPDARSATRSTTPLSAMLVRKKPPTPHPSTKSTLNPEASPFATVPTTTAFCSDDMQTVFLQTARAIIHHPSEPHVSLEVHLILDGGSQKSYISERARNLLKLEPIGEQSLSIVTFGSSKGNTNVCPIVNVGMCLRAIRPCHSFCM